MEARLPLVTTKLMDTVKQPKRFISFMAVTFTDACSVMMF